MIEAFKQNQRVAELTGQLPTALRASMHPPEFTNILSTGSYSLVKLLAFLGGRPHDASDPMTREMRAAFHFAHQANIDRYRRILATHLTAHERAFVERRIAEEQSVLQQFTKGAASAGTSADAA